MSKYGYLEVFFRVPSTSRVNCIIVKYSIIGVSIDIMSRPRGYKTFFMLNSTEHEIFPAHECLNDNNGWHYNIYAREK